MIVDWVPAHFPKDDWALARFDGTALYEHADPRQGEHPDWGTLVFNFGRNEVRNFLMANALYWIEEFHIDGLRVDAVASMLYLDYSREEGEWVPNEFGGRENLEAVSFLQEINTVVHGEHPGVLTIAEESTAWPAVSRPIYVGGLGFALKWNMGWMHDTLDYFPHEPVHRRFHHHELTFGLLYAFTENFVPAAVATTRSCTARARCSRRCRATAGSSWPTCGRCTPGCGPTRASSSCSWAARWPRTGEWSHDRSLDWHLLEHPSHAGVDELPRDAQPPVQGAPGAVGAGLRARRASAGSTPTTPTRTCCRSCAARPTARTAAGGLHRQPDAGAARRLPGRRARGGRWREVLNTDAADFGGSGVGNGGAVEADGTAGTATTSRWP